MLAVVGIFIVTLLVPKAVNKAPKGDTLASFSDIKKLKSLLSPKMIVNFEEAVLQKNKDNIKSELTFIGMKESKLEKFEEVKNEFFATVKFVCEIISVKKDKDDKVIEGNPDIIKTVTDHWKFSKNISSKNPNWNLSEIISK